MTDERGTYEEECARRRAEQATMDHPFGWVVEAYDGTRWRRRRDRIYAEQFMDAWDHIKYLLMKQDIRHRNEEHTPGDCDCKQLRLRNKLSRDIIMGYVLRTVKGAP